MRSLPRRRPVLGLRARLMLLVAAGVLVPTVLAALAGLASLGALTDQLLRERASLAAETQVRAEHAVGEALERLSGIAVPAPAESAGREGVRVAFMHSRMFAAMALVDSRGVVIAQEPAAYPLHSLMPTLLATSAAARSLGRPAASPALIANGSLAHAIIVPLRDRSGEMSHVAVGIRNLDERRWNVALRAPRLDDARVDLIDETGVIIASSDAARVGARDANGLTLAGRPRDREPRIVRTEGPDGELVVAATPLGVLPWTIAIEQPARSLLAPVVALQQRLVLLVPAALVVGLLFAWGAAASVRQPLAVLTRAAERVAGGDIDDAVPVLPDDEIGRLGRALETMRRHLAELLARVRADNAHLEARVAERTHALEAAHQELQARDAQRSKLFGRVLSAQEEERRRLARELHDETCQKIAAIGMRLDMAAQAESVPAIHAGIGEARSLAARTLEDVHRVIFDLRPSVLDDLGLLAAIRWFAARQLEATGVRVRCDFPDSIPPLSPNVEIALFRAVQEAISNSARHAHAEQVVIELGISRNPAEAQSHEQGRLNAGSEEGGPLRVQGEEGRPRVDGEEDGSPRREAGAARLHIEIEDDGIGFDVDGMRRPNHSGQGLGLLGLRERMELVGGQAVIDSTPGDGTRVVLEVPIPEGASR